jgi:hypothetical protein
VETNEPATVVAQDVNTRIEDALYGASEPEEIVADDVVAEGDPDLPETDDTDSIDDNDGSEEEVLEADEEDLSLASYLGIDEDRLIVGEDGVVSFNAIIDGETKAVPLKDLASSYQLQGHVNNKSIALENERKEFHEQRDVASEELVNRVSHITQLGDMMEKQLVGQFDSIDWDTLRTEAPAEWSALRQEFAEKAQDIQKMQAIAHGEQKKIAADQQQKNNEMQQNYLQGEFQKVIQDNPDWADDAKRNEAQGKIKTFLTSSYGFSEEDILGIADHRAIKVIQDAMAYRNGKKAAEVKKTKTVPKFQKPGASKKQTASLAKARSVKAQRAAITKSGGKVQDVANLLINRM